MQHMEILCQDITQFYGFTTLSTKLCNIEWLAKIDGEYLDCITEDFVTFVADDAVVPSAKYAKRFHQ